MKHFDRRSFLKAALVASPAVVMFDSRARAFTFGAQNSLNYAAMGDSLTADRAWFVAGGATPAQCYVSRIARLRGYANSVNAGISGNTTTQMLARFGTDILAHRPGTASIMGFTNDQSTNTTGTYPSITWTGTGISLATTKANIKSMVQQLQAIRCRATILSPCAQRYEPYLSHSAAYLSMLADIKTETGCEYMDVYTRIIGLSEAQQDALYIPTDLLGHWSGVGHGYAATMSTEPAFASCFAQFS